MPRDPGRRKPAGVRAIIAYKVIKGTAGLALATILFILLLAHETGPLERIAVHVHAHFTRAWSVALADLLLRAAEPHHLWFVTLALTMDGSLTLLEGWALHHGHWWGPWLVVAATSSLIPFEIVSLVHHLRVGRLVLLVLNAGIVVYLVWRALKDRREQAEEERGERRGRREAVG
jgi:uncharacterized membrane protein (DUF2068 family)